MFLVNEWYFFNNALDDSICQKIIALGEDDFRQAKVDVSTSISDQERVTGKAAVPGTDTTLRTSSIRWIKEQWLFDLIWPYMLHANENAGWKYDIRAMESCQLTRYETGEFYSWHRDGRSDHLSTYNKPDNAFLHGHVRKLSMTVLLNDDFEGGEFEFACYRKEKLTVEKPAAAGAGSIVVFPAFKEHRVTPVVRGTRYSLVAWFLGPPFK